jgi:hypothetical protein
MKVAELHLISLASTTIETLRAIFYVSLAHLKTSLARNMMSTIMVDPVFTYSVTKETVILCSPSSITTENA